MQRASLLDTMESASDLEAALAEPPGEDDEDAEAWLELCAAQRVKLSLRRTLGVHEHVRGPVWVTLEVEGASGWVAPNAGVMELAWMIEMYRSFAKANGVEVEAEMHSTSGAAACLRLSREPAGLVLESGWHRWERCVVRVWVGRPVRFEEGDVEVTWMRRSPIERVLHVRHVPSGLALAVNARPSASGRSRRDLVSWLGVRVACAGEVLETVREVVGGVVRDPLTGAELALEVMLRGELEGLMERRLGIAAAD